MSIIILLSSLFFILFFFAIWHIPTDKRSMFKSYTAIGHYYQRKVYSFCFCEYLAISAFSLLSPSISSFGNIKSKSGNMIANCALSVELKTKFSIIPSARWGWTLACVSVLWHWRLNCSFPLRPRRRRRRWDPAAGFCSRVSWSWRARLSAAPVPGGSGPGTWSATSSTPSTSPWPPRSPSLATRYWQQGTVQASTCSAFTQGQ